MICRTGKVLQQRRQTVEVIGVGVRKDDLVDAPAASLPQKRSDMAARQVRSGQGPSIVDQHAAAGSFDDGAAAVPHGQKGAAKTAAVPGPHQNQQLTMPQASAPATVQRQRRRSMGTVKAGIRAR